MPSIVSRCNRAILNGFYNYGYFVGKHPVPFLVIPLILCCGLGVGILFMDPETDMDTLYTPLESDAKTDGERIDDIFPDRTRDNYHPFSLNKLVPNAAIIFRTKKGSNSNILVLNELQGIQELVQRVTAINVTYDGIQYTFQELCAKYKGQCVVDGDFLFDPAFVPQVNAGNITFPYGDFQFGRDLSRTITRVSKNGAVLTEASSIKMFIPLRMDSSKFKKISFKWEEKFIDFMEGKPYNLTNMDLAYSTSQSLNIELDRASLGDIQFFILTFILMISYACLVSAGGNLVSTRAILAMGGVMATMLGILSAFGFITFTGIRFVNMAGITPFLLLGIGVDDMFLLMSSWSETTDLHGLSVPERIGMVFKKAGIGITITSVTNFLSFAVGTTSVFYSVRNFCIYTGFGVVMCYVANASFFGACLAIHGYRVFARRHTVTCMKVDKSPQELREEGRSLCYAYLCGGSVPDHAMADQSSCEKGPRSFLPRLIMWKPARICIIFIFMGYLSLSIYGCTILKEGLDLNDLVLTSSYAHKFQTWDKDFGTRLPIAFVTTKDIDYSLNSTLMAYESLTSAAENDPLIESATKYCWLTAYARTPFYNTTSDAAFMTGLDMFLAQTTPMFSADLTINNGTITASRCIAYSENLVTTTDQVDVMTNVRDIAADSPVAEFAYHPAFIYYEQFILILPSTIQTVGITLAVMMVVTALFLPHPLIVLLVMMQVVMIVTGIFGFMAFWDLTLSSITMVHLIMSVGFSVDFCAHVCTAYMVSEKSTREDRAKDAVVHASGPILNGGTSSLVGIMGLIFSESFIFQSFFKVMLLVIGFGVAHAVFFVPVLLSYIGPKSYMEPEDNNVPSIPNGNNLQVDRNHSSIQERGSPPLQNVQNGKTNTSTIINGTSTNHSKSNTKLNDFDHHTPNGSSNNDVVIMNENNSTDVIPLADFIQKEEERGDGAEKDRSSSAVVDEGDGDYVNKAFDGNTKQ